MESRERNGFGRSVGENPDAPFDAARQVVWSELVDGLPPKLRLPTVVSPVRPPRQEVRAVHDVLVEHAGDRAREAKAAIVVSRLGQIASKSVRRRLAQELRDGPLEPLAFVRLGLFRRAGVELREHPLDERSREWKPRVGPYTEPPSESQAEPALHALALNDDHFLLKRR